MIAAQTAGIGSIGGQNQPRFIQQETGKTARASAQGNLRFGVIMPRHDEENRSQEGEQVKIRECQPVSKRKFFEVVYDEAAQA